MRPWVFCTGLRYGDASDFTYLWSRYTSSNVANDQLVMLSAAGCTLNQASLNLFLNTIVSGSDDIRPQDYSSAIASAVRSNEENTMRVFTWLQSNVQQTTTTLGSVSPILNEITARLLNEAQITQYS
uniref:ERAP1-like C-terminal domain-containing protein n=1 Tax=Heliothis virescens TaxID=7102 RepID=A0A2A4J8M6_HELVI